jgi:GNAT superfamily N-acetyltransferase
MPWRLSAALTGSARHCGRTLSALAGSGGDVGTIDVTLVAPGTGGRPRLPERNDLSHHPRVRHAARLRDDVRVFGDGRGLVTLARGLAGRTELSVELAPDRQGQGLGPSLVADAMSLVEPGQPVFAAVAPGNARSLRVFLALGFLPIGCETIIRPAP